MKKEEIEAIKKYVKSHTFLTIEEKEKYKNFLLEADKEFEKNLTN